MVLIIITISKTCWLTTTPPIMTSYDKKKLDHSKKWLDIKYIDHYLHTDMQKTQENSFKLSCATPYLQI